MTMATLPANPRGTHTHSQRRLASVVITGRATASPSSAPRDWGEQQQRGQQQAQHGGGQAQETAARRSALADQGIGGSRGQQDGQQLAAQVGVEALWLEEGERRADGLGERAEDGAAGKGGGGDDRQGHREAGQKQRPAGVAQQPGPASLSRHSPVERGRGNERIGARQGDSQIGAGPQPHREQRQQRQQRPVGRGVANDLPGGCGAADEHQAQQHNRRQRQPGRQRSAEHQNDDGGDHGQPCQQAEHHPACSACLDVRRRRPVRGPSSSLPSRLA
jgi:hypothetical protein